MITQPHMGKEEHRIMLMDIRFLKKYCKNIEINND